MFKFFRKIRQNLLSEGRTTKYLKYAIGEIILVMIGILLALQVNNWNEIQKEQKRELAYLKRLQEDVAGDLEHLNLNVDFYKKVFASGNTVLNYTDENDLNNESHWQILVSFFHASQIWPLIPTSSTYDELKSSGDLSLINSISLRNNLAYYHGGGLDRYNHTVGIVPPYRKMVRGLIPITIQNYMWENCHATSNDAQILKECASSISEERSKQIIDDLAKNSNLLEELRYYMSSIKVGMSTIIEQRELCQKMLKEISEIQNK